MPIFLKKPVLYTLVVVLVVPTLVFGFQVHTGCACIDGEGLLLHITNDAVIQYKAVHGAYPTYEELLSAAKSTPGVPFSGLGGLKKYEGVAPKTSGVFYDSTQNKDGYVLRRYAKTSYFGMTLPFVWEVK